MSRTRGQSGTSLVEVLTVIVVLLVGIFAAVRLFPAGFSVNRQTSQADMATRLANAEIDRFTAGAANLMDAIAPGYTDPTSGAFVFDELATPDDLSPNLNPPTGVDAYYVSDINRFRHVIGETVRVPVSTPIGNERGGVYMLSLGPVVLTPDTGATFRGITVYSGSMQRVAGMDPNDPDSVSLLQQPTQYGVDTGSNRDGASVAARICLFPSPYERRFRLTYNYYDPTTGSIGRYTTMFPADGDTDARTTMSGSERVVRAGAGGWFTLAAPQYQPYMVADSESISRAFRQLGRSDLWGFQQTPPVADPYEFKVISDNTSFANLGVLAFNPTGRDYTEQLPGGARPLTARIDYDVLDWRILREDRSMPASSPYRVRLLIPGIKKLGDIQDDQTQYAGIFGSAGGPDVMVYNLGTGQVVDAANYVINYEAGNLTFTDAFAQDAANATATFRFLYKARNDWGLQVQKAARAYHRNVTTGLGYDDYYLGTRFSSDLQRDVPTLLFSLSEAGKTVSVRELSYALADGTIRMVQHQTLKINASPTLFVQINGRTLTPADVATRTSNSDAAAWPDPTGNPTVVPVVGVEGISFRARAIWSGGTTINRNAVATDRVRTTWKHREVDSALMRPVN